MAMQHERLNTTSSALVRAHASFLIRKWRGFTAALGWNRTWPGKRTARTPYQQQHTEHPKNNLALIKHSCETSSMAYRCNYAKSGQRTFGEFNPTALPPSAYGSAKQNNNFGFRVLGCFGLAVGLRLGMIEALRTAPTQECHRLQG